MDKEACESHTGMHKRQCRDSEGMVSLYRSLKFSLKFFGHTELLRGSMSKKDRLAYIDAVLCLQSKPPNAAPGLVPGARSRFDDFQAVHINQTYLIHFNVGAPK